MKFDVKAFKAIGDKIKNFWSKLSQKSKKLIIALGGAVLLSIALTGFFLGFSKGQYKVLFPGMSNEEAAQVYATVQEMGVQPRIDDNGQVLVPGDQWDNLVFELNSKGYPKTTLSYDTFTSASGFTSTEFEKRTALIFQVQDRMQQTLLRQDGVADAAVNITVPETTNYVWNQSNQQESSAGITVTMKAGYKLTPERVSAIKHLAATSVPGLAAENVVVVDGTTGVEMVGLDDPSGAGYYSVKRLELEEQICKGIEDKVTRLLAGKYGVDGVTAVATVELDYDKMVTESKQYQPRDGANGGVYNHFEENYSLNGNVAAEGIVGEEDNTDSPPIYPNREGDGDAEVTDYNRVIDYDVSYVLTQIEKGEPILKRASIAVIVNDPDFDAEVEDTLVDLISKAANITSDNIRVTNLDFEAQQVVAPVPSAQGLSTRQMLLIGLGALLIILIIVIVIVVLVRRKRKNLEAQEMAELEEAERQRRLDMEREIENHKRMLQNEAMAQAQTKESAITEEVREFAQENPELTASLIRSLIREDK